MGGPKAAPLARNWTEPVGVPPAGAAATTVAVNVTPCPKTDGSEEDVTDVAVSAGRIASVSVAELLFGFGSSIELETTEVFSSSPGTATGDTVAFTVKVTEAAGGKLTDALMSPLPLSGQTPPLLLTQVQKAAEIAVGNVSDTVAVATGEGPEFEAVMVYMSAPPGPTVVTPSVFVIDRLAIGLTMFVSVEELFSGTESVVPCGGKTLAMLATVPEVAVTFAETIKVTIPPSGRVGMTIPSPCIRLTVVFSGAGQTAPP